MEIIESFMRIIVGVMLALPYFTCIVWLEVWRGSYAILRLGRNNSKYRKLKKSLSISDRILRRNFVQLSTKAVRRYQRFFVNMTYLGYLSLIVLIAIWIVSLFTHDFTELFRYYLYIKGYAIELPALIFVYSNQCRTKDKVNYEWKFVRDYRNRKK